MNPIPQVPSPSFALLLLAGFAISSLLTGCAVHYFDPKSGTEHLWGFGHLKMKALPSNEGLQAIVKGTETLGLNLAAGPDDYHIGVGWNYYRRMDISSNAAVRIEWPTSDFFNIRIGTKPPFMTNATDSLGK